MDNVHDIIIRGNDYTCEQADIHKTGSCLSMKINAVTSYDF